jgi:hypothetical protein
MQPFSEFLLEALLEARQQGGAAAKNNVEVEIALEVCVAALHSVDNAVHYALVPDQSVTKIKWRKAWGTY